MATYNVDDLARSIIAMYLSNALQKDMEKRGFTPVKAGQDPAAGMMPPPTGGMPPMDMAGMAPPGGPPGAPPMGGPPMGGPPMGGPPGAMPPGPGGPMPIAGAGDLGSLMGLLGAMPPPPPEPPPEGKPEEKPEGKPKEELEREETPKVQKAEVTPTTLYTELVKVRKLLVGIYDALNLKIPSDALSDEEVYLTEKEEVRQSPKEKEQTTPALSPPPETAQPNENTASIPPDIKKSIFGG